MKNWIIRQHWRMRWYREFAVVRKIRLQNRGETFSKQVILSQATPECIRNYTLRFLMGIARVEGEMRGDANQEEELRYMMESVRSSHTQKELQYQFQKVVKQAIAWNEETEENITENGIVLNAIAYIREHYMEAVGLQDVAQCCNVSPEYLSRIFKEETGVKFVDFLANFRISMGKRMLATGNYKVAEVAEATGFNDQKYFQKVFKRSVESLRQNIKRRTADEVQKNIIYTCSSYNGYICCTVCRISPE